MLYFLFKKIESKVKHQDLNFNRMTIFKLLLFEIFLSSIVFILPEFVDLVFVSKGL